jgi:hypothetical protein
MKRLGVGVVLICALAATAWFVWAAVSERAVAGWFAERQDAGWIARYDTLSIQGFPLEFVTVMNTVELADPATGWAWSAPEFTLRQTAWNPDRTEAIWPSSQTLASPFERLDITAGHLSALLDVQPSSNLALDASRTQINDLHITSTANWQLTLAQALAEVTRLEGEDARYSIEFHASDLTPPEDVAAILDPAGVLPPAIPVVTSSSQIAFDRAWDMSAIETERPQIRRIELSEARAEWGDLMLRASGNLDVDDQGRPDGDIAIRAENWETMLDMANRAGLLPQALRGTARTALGFLASLSGDPEDIDATISFDEGFMFFGPLPIGEAPRLILR